MAFVHHHASSVVYVPHEFLFLCGLMTIGLTVHIGLIICITESALVKEVTVKCYFCKLCSIVS